MLLILIILHRRDVSRQKKITPTFSINHCHTSLFVPPLTLSASPPRLGTDLASGSGQSGPSGVSEPGLLVWVIAGCVVVLLLVIVVLLVLWRYRHQSRSAPVSQQQPAAVSLDTLTVPKRDSISSDNGSDRSNVVFPLRSSDSMICRHYERVSGEYGAPVYIVQEIMPQSPTNVYYKV